MRARAQHITGSHLITLAKGERVLETLRVFCKENGIQNALLHGIGAVRDTRMGYYDREKREYFFNEYPEVMEVVSMTGNVALVEGEPFLHVHATLSDTQNNAHGGHVEEMTVAVTLEVHMDAFEGAVERAYDDSVGLKLLEP